MSYCDGDDPGAAKGTGYRVAWLGMGAGMAALFAWLGGIISLGSR